MAVSDSVGDGLTKVRNASRARHPAVDLAYSRLLAEIVDVLRREGFIRTYKAVGESPAQRVLRVYLKYTPPETPGAAYIRKKTPAITQLIRISKPGARIYRKAHELPRVLGGLGVAIVSTSKGLLTERDAYQQHLGGEVICYVW